MSKRQYELTLQGELALVNSEIIQLIKQLNKKEAERDRLRAKALGQVA